MSELWNGLKNEQVLGTNTDGSKNTSYCSYCYENGAFISNCTMDEMIDSCANDLVKNLLCKNLEEARKIQRV
ncbi:MAG: zinc ribbon domain-containing protein [Aminipila sp.]